MTRIIWTRLYKWGSQGRALITSGALMALASEHSERVLDADLWGKQEKVLFLDAPFRLGRRVEDSKIGEYYLHRVRLNSLPGWPPRMASSANVQSLPNLMDCTLVECRFDKGPAPDQQAIELGLKHAGKKYRAWHVGCPEPLLKCEEATLTQKGMEGSLISSIQDTPLIGVV